MDKESRNLLQRATQAARRLLEHEFQEQLEGTFDVLLEGTLAPQPGAHLDAAQKLTRRKIIASIEHHLALAGDPKAAIETYLREAAFTTLNRFVAVKMLEARKLVQECISRGDQSSGFKEFVGLAPGLNNLPDNGYRLYIECVFDEIGREVRVLFNRLDPASLLWPRRTALLGLLESLNQPALASVWAEDETIGWVYQYFNDEAERRKMREESAAPRNSRELAVRNQFFTPRYVVSFLADNTLGRLWYEMRRGETALRDKCQYLIRRPNEIFLGEGEIAATPLSFEQPLPSIIGDPREAHSRVFLQEDPESYLPPSGWIKEAFEGNFENLPEDEPWTRWVGAAIPPEQIDAIMGERWQPMEDNTKLDRLRRSVLDGSPDPETRKLPVMWAILSDFARTSQFAGGYEWPAWKKLWSYFRHLAQTWQRFGPAKENPSQEELFQQPVFIPHRPLKDPREIRLIDPACGSMHFGLYAFELFETIYEEAWDRVPELRECYTAPCFPPESVKLLPDARAKCFATGREMPISEAVFAIVAYQPGAGICRGRPMIYTRQAAEQREEALALSMPLRDFDFATAVREQWSSHTTLSLFVEMAGCFQHPLSDPMTEEECSAAFRRDIPRLIIEHNIHGTDIDPRATQIAALALWMRAQKAWQAQGLRPAERPSIRRTNIVCAEPMPGERELLREFTAGLENRALGDLVERVFERMLLAGEAGSLLQIEEEIRADIAAAKKLWHERPRTEQMALLPEEEKAPAQHELGIDVSGVTDEQFWDRAEERIYAALREYAARATRSGAWQRRLFAEDAEQGFAFIDLLRKRYDVALMNPPFGDASLPSKPYIDATYGDTRGDVYKAFVECFHARLVPAGYLGIISSRTGFFLGQSEDWRTRVVLRLFRPIALADLGSGVLDAMVEVAAYVLRNLSEAEARDLTLSLVPVLEKVVRDKQDRFSLPKWQAARGDLKRHQAVAELEHLKKHGFIQRCPGDTVRYTPLWREVKKVAAPPAPVYPSLVCVRALTDQDKGAVLSAAARSSSDRRIFICDPSRFARLPGNTFSYWATPRLVEAFTNLPRLAEAGFEAWVGLQTNEDFRWLRLWWEVNEAASPAPDNRGEQRCWLPFAKGGQFAQIYCDIPLVVLWGRNGHLIKVWKKEQLRQGFITENNSQCWNESRYKRPGLTWPRRTNGLSFRVMPEGCIFGDKGPAVFSLHDDTDALLTILALLNSAVFVQMVGLMLARVSLAQSFEVGIVRSVPVPTFVPSIRERLYEFVSQACCIRQNIDSVNATSHGFVAPSLFLSAGSTLAERAAAWVARVRKSEETVAAIQAEIDDLAFCLYGLDAADRAALTATLATETTGDADPAEAGEDEETEAVTADAPALAADLLAYSVGCAFGRWDIRFATGERPAPQPPDPFDPLPVCPPGMLQNATGLPAAPEDVPVGYPVRITWPGILVDDPGHAEDITGRVREVMAVLWPERAEREAAELLGVAQLRDWLRRPAAFFADHLKRYSKSRRQAPIYWPLSTASANYTVWLYYPRLGPDTFYRVKEIVQEKLQHEQRRLTGLRQDFGPNPTATQRKELAAQETLSEELGTLLTEVSRIAPLWRPDLNDGAILNAAPLWRLFAHRPWQKSCREAWERLATGDYDWAHRAMHLWPERVVPKCARDRSLAIAHGLEAALWEQGEDGKWKGRKVPETELEALVAERTSPAVKGALAELLAAPGAATGPSKKRRK